MKGARAGHAEAAARHERAVRTVSGGPVHVRILVYMESGPKMGPKMHKMEPTPSPRPRSGTHPEAEVRFWNDRWNRELARRGNGTYPDSALTKWNVLTLPHTNQHTGRKSAL